MDYKTSQFNISLPVDNSDEIILFNTKECSFVVLDEKTQGFLKDINKVTTYDDDIVSNLVELGFLVDKGLDEVDYLVQATKNARLSTETLSITICTTLDCNMACYYCFEQKSNQYLSIDTADKIINFITTRLYEDQFKKLFISWTGGEPLLNKDIIQYISRPLNDYCYKNRIEYRASITTNGLLLTEDTSKLLNDMKIQDAQITIDGLKDTHNKRRVALDVSDGFKTILTNITTAISYLAVVIRINVDHNNKQEIKDLLKYLYGNLDFKNNKNISLILAQVYGCNTSLSLEEYLDFFRDIYDDYIINSTLEKYYPTPLNFACGAQCKNSYVIDPQGYVYKCWEEIGIDKYAIGTVEKVCDDCQKSQEYLENLWPKECESCSYIPICHGGCPIRRSENDNTPFCVPQTKVLDKYLKKYYELWKIENEEATETFAI